MSRTIVLTSAILLISLALPATDALLANPVSVTSASWGNNATSEAAPGDVGRTITVGFQNVDSVTYTGVSATISDSAAVHPAPGGETATLSGDFASGVVWTAHFVVNIDPSASPTAPVQIPVTLTMQPKGTTSSQTYPLSINARLTGHAALTISSNVTTLPASAHATIPLMVQDSGTGPAGGITMTIAPQQGSTLSVSGRDNVFNVGSLAPSQSVEVDVPVLTPAVSGQQTLLMNLAYANAAGASVQETHALTVRIADPLPGPLQVSLTSARLAQNQTGSVAFNIQNTGNGTLDNVAASFKVPSGSPPPFSVLNASDSPTLGNLGPGQGQPATLQLLVAAGAADPQPIVLTVSWYDDAGAFHQQSYNYTVRVAAQSPSATAALTAVLDQNRLSAGREDTLEFTLTNNGQGALQSPSVSFRLPANGLITPVNASDQQTIADVPAGGSAVIDLQLLTANAASDVYPLSMVVSWNDEQGGAHSQTFNYGVAVSGTVNIALSGLQGTASATASTVTLSATLTNLGNAIAHNAYISVGFGGGFLPTDPVYLGDIDQNTALPFTLPTSVLNGTLNATGGGGFGRGGQGGFPVNRTGGGRGFGGRGGNNVTLTLTWNDDYGAIHSQTYTQPVAVRGGGNRQSATAATASASKVPAIGLSASLAAVVGVAIVLARRRSR